MQLQILPPNSIDESYSTFGDANKVVAGIEFDRDGRTMAYHIRQQQQDEQHTKERLSLTISEAALMFVPEFVGQWRGIPALSSCMVKLKNLAEYEQAQLLKQKLSACVVDYIIGPYDDGASFFGHDKSKYGEQEEERIEPGIRKRLRPGEEVRSNTPPHVDGYPEHVRQHLYSIASGLEVPYPLLSGDFSQTNYSSFRGMWLAFHKDLEVLRTHVLIPQICERVVDWFLEGLEVMGVIRDRSKVVVTYTPPRRELIDPTREIPSLIKSIRAGIDSWHDVQKSFGNNPLETLDEIEKYNKEFDRRGVILDCDGRRPG
jgi:lambda family phage portal protein